MTAALSIFWQDTESGLLTCLAIFEEAHLCIGKKFRYRGVDE